MSAIKPLPRLPIVLLGAMTVASFCGPLVILVVVRGGASTGWPPDRPVEWLIIALVLAIEIVLFAACVSINWWFRPIRSHKRSESPKTEIS
jgi:hypothetical protein